MDESPWTKTIVVDDDKKQFDLLGDAIRVEFEKMGFPRAKVHLELHIHARANEYGIKIVWPRGEWNSPTISADTIWLPPLEALAIIGQCGDAPAALASITVEQGLG